MTDDGRAPIGVRRMIQKPPPPQGATVRGELAALFAGPSVAERKAGITTAISYGTKLRRLSFSGLGGTTAIVDLSGLPPVESTSAAVKVQVITQVARTVIGSGGIRRIWLRSDGKPWDLLDMQGNVGNRPIDYRCSSASGSTVSARCRNYCSPRRRRSSAALVSSSSRSATREGRSSACSTGSRSRRNVWDVSV